MTQKFSLNSIKLFTIYAQIERYLNNNPDISNLLHDLDQHPFNDAYTLPPEHFIPYRFTNCDIPESHLSYFIDALDAYQTRLNTQMLHISFLFNIKPDLRAVYDKLFSFYLFYVQTINKFYPDKFLPF